MVPERTAVFTVRIAHSFIARLTFSRAFARQALSATVAKAVRSYLDQARERHGGKAR